MQEWPDEVEAALSKIQLPSADLDVSLAQYVDIACGTVLGLQHLSALGFPPATCLATHSLLCATIFFSTPPLPSGSTARHSCGPQSQEPHPGAPSHVQPICRVPQLSSECLGQDCAFPPFPPLKQHCASPFSSTFGHKRRMGHSAQPRKRTLAAPAQLCAQGPARLWDPPAKNQHRCRPTVIFFFFLEFDFLCCFHCHVQEKKPPQCNLCQ